MKGLVCPIVLIEEAHLSYRDVEGLVYLLVVVMGRLVCSITFMEGELMCLGVLLLMGRALVSNCVNGGAWYVLLLMKRYCLMYVLMLERSDMF